MSLELQVQQNTQAIKQILEQAKNLSELPVYENQLSGDDLIMFYIQALDQTISIEYSRFLELINPNEIELIDVVKFTPQSLTPSQKQQAQTNIGVNEFQNPLTAYQNALNS